jgi:hypothetical protein
LIPVLKHPNLQVENEETIEALSARSKALLDGIQQRFSFFYSAFSRLIYGRAKSPIHPLARRIATGASHRFCARIARTAFYSFPPDVTRRTRLFLPLATGEIGMIANTPFFAVPFTRKHASR